MTDPEHLLRPCDNSAVAVFDDRDATGTLDLHMPFVALEGETLILVHIFALTEFGFPGQLTLPRRPVATVGTKVTKKTRRPRTWTLRKSLRRTTWRRRTMYSWTIDVGRSRLRTQARTCPARNVGTRQETPSDPRTPSNALTGQDPEIFRANPEAIEAAGFLQWSACEETSRLPSKRVAAQYRAEQFNERVFISGFEVKLTPGTSDHVGRTTVSSSI